MGRTAGKFLFGGIIFVISQLTYIFTWVRTLDWVQHNMPKLSAFIGNTTFQTSLVIVSIALFATGLHEIWDLRHELRESTSPLPTVEPKSNRLSLLFVRMYREFPHREDLAGQYLLSAFIRSDYDRPAGVQFIGWQNCLSEVPISGVSVKL